MNPSSTLAANRSLTHEGRTYILASSLIAEHRVRVLKHNETFAVFDRYGEIYTEGEEGLYYKGTRHLSQSEFTFGDVRPLLMNSNITHDNLLLTVDLANPDFRDAEGKNFPRGVIHVLKTLFLHNGSCFERIRVSNFAGEAVRIPITFHFDSDFKDIFEIRGTARPKRGKINEPYAEETGLRLSYRGLDAIERRTRISYYSDQAVLKTQSGRSLEFVAEAKEQSIEIYLCYDFWASDETEPAKFGDPKSRYNSAFSDLQQAFQSKTACDAIVTSSNEQFNGWISRSHSDLRMMVTETPFGPYPYAGVPWFSAAFGRDGIITALQTLWVNPDIAKGVLSFLAKTQSTELSPERDAEPGKILHESRYGEMANLNEIPFARYYGTVDATPLFVVLAGEYLKATADLDFVRSIWGNIEAALRWINDYGDADKDGFVEYSRRSAHGLTSQGWKDSYDSIFHADGSDAKPPVALCEVQGYVYHAKLNAALIADKLGMSEMALDLREKAKRLKAKFNSQFWCEETGTLALALDGEKRRCMVRSSNTGHCLYSGIVADERVPEVVEVLMNERSYCGWGIRTISEGEARYNPMSYHNGSVWPHDTSIAAMGLAKYGYKDQACKLLSGMLEVSHSMDLNRLPELFCGFEKNSCEVPTLYPLSCAPQAWAAGAAFFLLQACLGMRLDAYSKHIVFDSPELPLALKTVRICGLRLGTLGSADVEFIRHTKHIGMHVLRRDAGLSVIAVT